MQAEGSILVLGHLFGEYPCYRRYKQPAPLLCTTVCCEVQVGRTGSGQNILCRAARGCETCSKAEVGAIIQADQAEDASAGTLQLSVRPPPSLLLLLSYLRLNGMVLKLIREALKWFTPSQIRRLCGCGPAVFKPL